jgi:hypothetical protein
MQNFISRATGTVAAAAVLVVGGALVGPQAVAWAAEQIPGDRITENSIDQSEIQNGSVTSADVDNGTITGLDVKNGSLSGADIAPGAVSREDIADNTITPEKLNQGMLLEWIKAPESGLSDTNGRLNGTWQNLNGETFGEFQLDRGEGTALITVSANTLGDSPVRVRVEDPNGQLVASCIAEEVPSQDWAGTCSGVGLSSWSRFLVYVDGGAAKVDVTAVRVQ